ncbi:hypothetical protein EDD21DRAFT_179508 [Dissophora ornata]|nr:hypothetical protein EDD21DRAFT_179508 [Dissophora ornata]
MSTITMAKAKGKKSLPALAMLLPHELLVKIFYNLEERPQHRHTSISSISFSYSLSLDRTDILSCALVCRDWYYAAVDTLWRDVDIQSVESFIQFSGTLDPAFSYMDSNTAVPKLTHGHGYGYDAQFMDADDDEDSKDEQQGECRAGELLIDRKRSTCPSVSSPSSSSSSLSSISSVGYYPIPGNSSRVFWHSIF